MQIAAALQSSASVSDVTLDSEDMDLPVDAAEGSVLKRENLLELELSAESSASSAMTGSTSGMTGSSAAGQLTGDSEEDKTFKLGDVATVTETVSMNTISRDQQRRCVTVTAAIADGYKRLMAPSLEREARAKLTVRAQTEAINVFAKNLEGLLSARPVRGARVLALDPGYRTGCKVAVMDETGKLLDHGVVYPTKPRHDVTGTKRELARLVKKDGINTIVIGNGTASRETEEVVSEFIAEQAPSLRYTIVNEAGASVYSAGKLAEDDIPDYDVDMISSISIARRIHDPLPEQEKIDPNAIP